MKPINWTLGDIKIFHDLKATAKNGESNGLDIILDAEQFNYAFYHENTDSNGGGFKLTLHDHRDKPMIQFSSQLIHTGTETQINVKPTITYTTGWFLELGVIFSEMSEDHLILAMLNWF